MPYFHGTSISNWISLNTIARESSTMGLTSCVRIFYLPRGPSAATSTRLTGTHHQTATITTTQGSDSEPQESSGCIAGGGKSGKSASQLADWALCVSGGQQRVFELARRAARVAA